MSQASDLEKIRRVLQLARAEINRQQPDLALENLRAIKDDIEQYRSTPEWAEFSLLFAEAHCAKCDPLAENYLSDAREKILNLSDTMPDLEFRVSEQFGDFYSRVAKKISKAREHYANAKSLAQTLGVGEFVARINLKIIRIDLHTDQSPEQENFKTLRRVGKAGNFTCEQQLAAWHLHYGESDAAATGLRFARHFSKGSEDYFKELLNSVR